MNTNAVALPKYMHSKLMASPLWKWGDDFRLTFDVNMKITGDEPPRLELECRMSDEAKEKINVVSHLGLRYVIGEEDEKTN